MHGSGSTTEFYRRAMLSRSSNQLGSVGVAGLAAPVGAASPADRSHFAVLRQRVSSNEQIMRLLNEAGGGLNTNVDTIPPLPFMQLYIMLLRHCLEEETTTGLHNKFYAANADKDIRELKMTLEEKNRLIDSLPKVFAENKGARERIISLETSLHECARENERLKQRLQRQAAEISAEFETRVRNAKNNAMAVINEQAMALMGSLQRVEDQERVDLMRSALVKFL